MPYPRILSLLVLLAFFAGALGLEAQVRVEVRMSKRQYIAHEPVLAIVTLTNHAGRELLLHADSGGRRPVSWLDFSLRNSRGATLSPLGTINFRSTRVPAGQSVSKTVDLNALYRVSELGNYGGHAVVRLPGKAGIFNSNRISFSVTKGHTQYTQRIGDPASRNVREYRVSTFNSSKRSSVYVHLVEVRTGRTLRAFKLGDALSFKKPTSTVDGKNNLHVLFLASPGVFAHARVSPDGKQLGTSYFKRGAAGQPGLLTFGNGQVVVKNGVPHDPKAETRRRAKIRRLSERPSLTYR